MEDIKSKWWYELRHGGLLISPPVFSEIFGDKLLRPSGYKYNELRENYFKFERKWLNDEKKEKNHQYVYEWIDYIFGKFLDHSGIILKKSNELSKDFTVNTILGEKITPDRGLFKSGEEKSLLLISIDFNKQVGQGKSKKSYGKFLQLLRKNNVRTGIFTNGMQIRLVYAGLDYDSWAEWEVSNWFEDKSEGNQLNGFFTVFSNKGLNKTDDYEYPLLEAIELSRTKQGELSSLLGEQIRESIEILLDEFSKYKSQNPGITDLIKKNGDSEISDEMLLNAIYQSSVRIVMRIIVVLFSEAKGLLPNENPLYFNHYGIEGLFEILKSAGKSESVDYLDSTNDGWLRILALFRMIYFGSQLSDLNIPKYGGKLFEPGNKDSIDAVSRALYIFENKINDLSNKSLLFILEKLKYGKIKVKRGRGFTYVRGPVDFRELRTEYIGIIYQGILDYELKSSKEIMLILNAGLQPILPLSVLEGMSDNQIKDLFSKISKEAEVKSIEEVSEDDTDNEEPEIANGETTEEKNELFSNDGNEKSNDDDVSLIMEEGMGTYESESYKRVLDWTEKAVKILNRVKKPSKNADLYIYNDKVRKYARNLILKVINKSDLYLSRWGGTRKGTGTFYTKPQLVVPTVQRTLDPLCYKNDENDKRIPKTPEELLSLKVCDISCGSGPFLTASMNYITDILYDSLVFHCNLLDINDYKYKTLPFGLKIDTGNNNDYLQILPDDDNFESLVKAKLKRYVVERCIYGVDINPTAVELAKLSLWIETMDKNLPFEFLDHKIKTGNSLVGAWLDTFQEYPLAAWLREGGDASHNTSINFKKGKWTKEIKNTFNKKIKPEIIELIKIRLGITGFNFALSDEDVFKSHSKLLDIYNNLSGQSVSMFDIGQKEKIYFDELLKNENYIRLKDAMNLYCALWFWPGDKIEYAPTPLNYYSPDEESKRISNEIAENYRFFHWEIEFPDVFNQYRRGFDAIMGNPPWEISKPNSKEFFTNIDPVYRTYGKQEALNHQIRIFQSNKNFEYDWLIYNSYFKGFSNYVKNVAFPFGNPEESKENSISLVKGKENLVLHNSWKIFREKHKGYANKNHPYRYQGSADLNLYKLSLEQTLNLIKFGGRLGIIVPSGIYSDNGTKELRKLFLDENKWELIFSFENKKGIFDIHKSFKFCINIIEKGGETNDIKTSFMRHNLSDWENEIKYILYNKNDIKKLSPYNYSLLEIVSKIDYVLLNSIFSYSVLLGNSTEDGWGLMYKREYDSDLDSKLFLKRKDFELNGYKRNEYDIWIKPESKRLYPLYEGRMIEQYDYSAKSYVSGSNRKAVWEYVETTSKYMNPQFLISEDNHNYSNYFFKIASMRIGSATNTRSMYSCLIDDLPCNDSVPVLYNENLNICELLSLTSVLNSFVYDYVLRQRLGGVQINYYILKETPLIIKSKLINYQAYLTSKLTFIHNKFSIAWLILRHELKLENENWHLLKAITKHERVRLKCILDAVVSELYGLNYDDLKWILKNDKSNPKGFWRVDKDKPIELRQTTLTLQAFKRLKEVGLEEFIKEDWQFPKEIQDKLGQRFLDWQLKGTPEESWAECEMHAKNILGEEEYEKFIENINNPDAYKSDNKNDSGIVKEGENLYLF